jgi:hypothetical protein
VDVIDRPAIVRQYRSDRAPSVGGDAEGNALMPTAAAQIATWLVGPARLSGDPVAVVSGLVERLTRAGVPLDRIRISTRVVNPLVTAWGVSWTPETGAALYTVPRAVLETSAYAGSPVD